MILLQAQAVMESQPIMETGALSASWVLVGIAFAFFSLVSWVMLDGRARQKEFNESLSSIVKEQDEWLKIHDRMIIEQKGETKIIQERQDQLAKEFNRLRMTISKP
jgi:hypothetical protein